MQGGKKKMCFFFFKKKEGWAVIEAASKPHQADYWTAFVHEQSTRCS
jgi:hypothetical protein